MAKEISFGISGTTFIAGLVAAILVSSSLSTVIATQCARARSFLVKQKQRKKRVEVAFQSRYSYHGRLMQ